MIKPVLAVDLDDVVFRHAEAFIDWSNREWSTALTIDDYTEAWHELWQADPEETERRKRLFFTDEVVGTFEIVEGAGQGISRLAQDYTVIGVTSRRASLEAVTEETLETIAPGAVSQVKFATHFRDGEKITRSKVEICLEIGAHRFIEDQLKHCLTVSSAGIGTVLFGDYAWNRTNDLPSEIVRAAGWHEVPSALEALEQL